MKKYLAVLAGLLMILALGGCGKKNAAPLSVEDNPAHHYLMGMQLIESGDYDKAMSRFDRAVELDDEYARAIAGQSLVHAVRAQGEKDSGYKGVDAERALDLFDKAVSESSDSNEKFSVYITGIRIYTNLNSRGWEKRVEDLYDDASIVRKSVKEEELPYYRNTEALDYFMGEALFKAGKFRDSEDALGKVLSAAPGKWHEKARALSRRVQKIVLAMRNYTLTDVARKIAVKEEVDRADVAALLVDEIHLDKLFAGRIPVPASKNNANEFVPADVVNHMFEPEIMTVLKWHVRGLEPVYDQKSRAFLFYPTKPMTRKELAFVLEDVIVKLVGDKSIATKHLGQSKSLYPDVHPTDAWYNAIVTVVNRNLMETDLSGAFRPNDTMDGADLILSLMRLRNVMNIY
ncbi:S-layer homology domain-containing protein [Maridesulfovibrio bastinii]|uniref:S-layer homology domain-containing protein n=1 Tax=Maridesulfovibrio bastinii TaxID=47157 RepID=UPI000414F588|nr:S-layer homology domain-containing protein [Maridesulfovibrio bastinii]